MVDYLVLNTNLLEAQSCVRVGKIVIFNFYLLQSFTFIATVRCSLVHYLLTWRGENYCQHLIMCILCRRFCLSSATSKGKFSGYWRKLTFLNVMQGWQRDDPKNISARIFSANLCFIGQQHVALPGGHSSNY